MAKESIKHTIVTDTIGKLGRPLLSKRRERVMEEWEALVLDIYAIATPEARVKMVQGALSEITEPIERLAKFLEQTLPPEASVNLRTAILEHIQKRVDKMVAQQLPLTPDTPANKGDTDESVSAS